MLHNAGIPRVQKRLFANFCLKYTSIRYSDNAWVSFTGKGISKIIGNNSAKGWYIVSRYQTQIDSIIGSSKIPEEISTNVACFASEMLKGPKGINELITMNPKARKKTTKTEQKKKNKSLRPLSNKQQSTLVDLKSGVGERRYNKMMNNIENLMKQCDAKDVKYVIDEINNLIENELRYQKRKNRKNRSISLSTSRSCSRTYSYDSAKDNSPNHPGESPPTTSTRNNKNMKDQNVIVHGNLSNNYLTDANDDEADSEDETIEEMINNV